MKQEIANHFIDNGARALIEKESVAIIDAERKAKVIPLSNKKRIAFLKRENTLKTKTGEALIMLKPLLSELGTHGEEMKDTQAYNVELVSAIDKNSYFNVADDYRESAKKAINFLLQSKSLSDIAKLLIPNQPDYKGGVEIARTSFISLMRSINPTRFQMK